MDCHSPSFRRFILTLLISFSMLLIIGPLPALAHPGPAKTKAITKTAGTSPAIITSQTVIDPVVKLTKYQLRWVQDKSRFKIGKWSRQAGKSFATSLEAVLDCFENAGTTWVFLSAGERQSKELMRTAAIHARAINLAISEVEGTFKDENKTEYKQLEILFSNGSRIIGLPANPSTARGHSAHILLDEFGFHKDSREIWKALFPTVTRGYKIRIISTPQGKKNKFYELWTAKTLQEFDGTEHIYVGERGGYSKHNVTIDQAVTMGLDLYDEDGNRIEPEDLRLALNDDEAWHQEYLVEFMDETTAWLPYDLIETVEDSRLQTEPSWVERLLAEAILHHQEYKHLESPPSFYPQWLYEEVRLDGDLYLGYDVARHRDLAIIWADVKIDERYNSLAVVTLRKQPFGVQRNVLFSLMRMPKMRRTCIDRTGIGEDIAERAMEVFGPSRVEGIQFTSANKEVLAHGIKKSFEDQRDRIPADQTIRQSLHAVKKTTTDTGHFRFDAERSDMVGHADHFWAKALAVNARSTVSGPIEIVTRGTRESARMMRGYGDTNLNGF